MAQDRDEKAKSGCIQQANDALGKRDYAGAIQILEAGQIKFTASPEIDNLLRFAREQQTKDAKKQDIENSVRRAQEFLKNQEYDRAIALLESILKASPDEELSIVLEEARRRREALNNQIAAALARGRQFLEEGSPAKAVEFLQAQPTAYRRSGRFLVARCRPRPARMPRSRLSLSAPARSRIRSARTSEDHDVEHHGPARNRGRAPARTQASTSPPQVLDKSVPRSRAARSNRPDSGRSCSGSPAGLLQRLTIAAEASRRRWRLCASVPRASYCLLAQSSKPTRTTEVKPRK